VKQTFNKRGFYLIQAKIQVGYQTNPNAQNYQNFSIKKVHMFISLNKDYYKIKKIEEYQKIKIIRLTKPLNK